MGVEKLYGWVTAHGELPADFAIQVGIDQHADKLLSELLNRGIGERHLLHLLAESAPLGGEEQQTRRTLGVCKLQSDLTIGDETQSTALDKQLWINALNRGDSIAGGLLATQTS